MRRYLRDNNAIRVSRSLRDLAYRALQTREELSRSLQKEPSVSEIAMAMGEPDREDGSDGARIDFRSRYPCSSRSFTDDGDAIYVMDQVSDTKNTDARWIESLSLSEAMDKLSPRERHILKIRFFEGQDADGRWPGKSAFRRRRSAGWRKTLFRPMKRELVVAFCCFP